MATTRLISMHKNNGKSIANCLADRIDYALNPDKTNDGEYVSSYECDPKTVQGEFLLSKRIYSDITGRKQANDIIAYQILQPFKPGEVTLELANKIGYELALFSYPNEDAYKPDNSQICTFLSVLENPKT